jgi:hypothetical protein
VVSEPTAGLEVGLGVALQALDGALGLRVGRLAEHPPGLQLPAERGERLARATGVAVDAAWRSQTKLCGRPPRRCKQPAIPASRSGVSLENSD